MGDDTENDRPMYIYELPYKERTNLCIILDINNKWKELGGMYLKYSMNDLERFQRTKFCGNSPTESMLLEWGQRNATVNELFLYLWNMGHFQAMSAIKSCVPEKYHVMFETKGRFDGFLELEGRTGGAQASVESRRAIASTSNQRYTQVESNSQNNSQMNGDIGEGAVALPSPTVKYGSVNMNHDVSAPRHCLTSEKVPQSLLKPAVADALQSLQPSHHSMQGKAQAMAESKKIMNDRLHPEVSCDDNNPEGLLSVKSKKMPYDPLEDFNRKAEEKAKMIENEEAQRQMLNQNHIGAVGNQVKVKVNDAMLMPSGNVPNVSPTPPLHNNPSMVRQQAQHPTQERHRRISTASDVSRHSDCVVPVVPYKELEEATACWSKDNLLGRGGFGTVYKGNWKNSRVAVKKINLQGNADFDSAQLQLSQTMDELNLLLSFQHDNILQVFGYSADPYKSPCLVYQFMPNGSVEDRLQMRKVHGFDGKYSSTLPPLSWYQRFIIAVGTARALQYLHTVKERPLIHGDVKSANILLDKNFEPKLGDFGLAREGKSQSTSLKVSRVHGTKPYLPSDYLRSKKLSVKVDTYSYGIVLYELCTGLRAYDDKRKEGTKFLRELVEETPQGEVDSLRDQNIAQEPDIGIFSTLFGVAKNCVLTYALRRPEMEQVFSDLKNYLEVLEEQYKARNVSLEEMSIASSSPYQLQWQHDMTRRSLLTPLSPTEASLALSYPSPGPSSYMAPRSPIPPHPSVSPVPPHFPHPSTSTILPQYSPMPGAAYQYRQTVPRQHYPLNYHVAGHIRDMRPSMPMINVNHLPTEGAVRGPPPSYNEAVSPVGVSNNNLINPLLPQLSVLNIDSGPQQRITSPAASGSTGSSTDSSQASCQASTIHNVGQVNSYKNHPLQHGMMAYGARAVPATPPINEGNNFSGNIPLLTELNQTTTELAPPTAKNKKSIL